MKRIFANLLLMVLAFTVQTCIFPMIPFLSAAPNLLLILTFSFGSIHGSQAGMLYGLFAGLLSDLFYSGPFGFYMLVFVYIGYVNGICTKYYYEEYITLPLILCVLNELAYNLYMYVFRFLIRGKLNLLYYFREIMVPEIIFSVVATLFIYRLFLFTSRMLEELEKRRDTTIV